MATKLLEANFDKCTQCKSCEAACSKAFFKEASTQKSRIRVSDSGINVCNQCGECIKVCSEKALSMNKQGVVMLDAKRCVGCLICVGYCPCLCMHYIENTLTPFKCTACGICAKECPTQALAVVQRD